MIYLCLNKTEGRKQGRDVIMAKNLKLKCRIRWSRQEEKQPGTERKGQKWKLMKESTREKAN